MAAPAVLAVSAATTGSAFLLSLIAQVTAPDTPGADVLQYGSTGVLGMVTLGLGYAVIRGQLVSQNTADTAERERKYAEMLALSLKREEQWAASLDRQLDLREAERGGP